MTNRSCPDVNNGLYENLRLTADFAMSLQAKATSRNKRQI